MAKHEDIYDYDPENDQYMFEADLWDILEDVLDEYRLSINELEKLADNITIQSAAKEYFNDEIEFETLEQIIQEEYEQWN